MEQTIKCPKCKQPLRTCCDTLVGIEPHRPSCPMRDPWLSEPQQAREPDWWTPIALEGGPIWSRM
ncbi:MAG: hypothetical protein ACLQBX_03625 [Candidatus Limnocylindrales bacterium]